MVCLSLQARHTAEAPGAASAASAVASAALASSLAAAAKRLGCSGCEKLFLSISKQQTHADKQGKVKRQKCSKIDRCSNLRMRGILIPLQEGRWHYGWFLPWMPGGTMNDFIRRRHGWKAAGIIANFCHASGCQGVLWMTSAMDVTDEGEQIQTK
jgi:hypothetical protein